MTLSDDGCTCGKCPTCVPDKTEGAWRPPEPLHAKKPCDQQSTSDRNTLPQRSELANSTSKASVENSPDMAKRQQLVQCLFRRGYGRIEYLLDLADRLTIEELGAL